MNSYSYFSVAKYQTVWRFAAEAHLGVTLKGSELPYITHVGCVAAEIIASIPLAQYEEPDLAVVVALLHDVIEHGNVTAVEIEKRFSKKIAECVSALTLDDSIENRKERIIDSITRVRLAPKEAAAVRLADRICNLGYLPKEMTGEDRGDYIAESLMIARELGYGSDYLSGRLFNFAQSLMK